MLCNKCKREIVILPDEVQTVTLEDLDIQYFTCPHCGWKYVCFAADAKMRGLVEQRKAIFQQICAARAKKFDAKTIRGYLSKQEKIKTEQAAMLPKLRARAYRLLREVKADE